MTAMEVEEPEYEGRESLIVGLDLQPTQGDGVNELFAKSQLDGFDYCVTLLPTANDSTPRQDVLELPPETWRTSVVGQFPATTALTQAEWEFSLEWALHMSLPVVILPPMPIDEMDKNGTTAQIALYARLVEYASELCARSGCKLWIPLCPTRDVHLQYWRLLLQLCQYPSNVGMLVQLESYTSNSTGNSAAATVWLTQKLHRLHVAVGSGSMYAIQFTCDQFLINKKGYPTLSKAQQCMLTYLLRRAGRNIRLLCQGPATAPSRLPEQALGATQCLPHLQYLQHIRQRAVVRAVLDTHAARMEADYLDALQQPLQPLKDHLENQTYVVFEKDPVKYREYGRAIQMALQDRAAHVSLVLMVVGAGRGPLVTAALQAYANLPANERPKKLIVWAIEKNPSAVRRLQAMCLRNPTWRGTVQVLQADLRHLKAKAIGGRPADIVVSELLGSLGCNELSPECLDGLWATNAVHCDTISIPTSYTSHVAPVASIKLWQKARQQSLYPNRWETDVLGLTKVMETGYVARPYEASQMMAAQNCWTFQHPRPASAPTAATPPPTKYDHYNNRSIVLDFEPDPKFGIAQGCGYGPLEVDMDKAPTTADDASTAAASQSTGVAAPSGAFPWTLTGLLGSFTTLLYQRNETERVYLSTCPDNFSVGMFSWFPLYLPIETPVTVPVGATVRVHLWRKVDPDNSVWYEWAVGIWKGGKNEECLSMTPIHNPSGRSSKVSL